MVRSWSPVGGWFSITSKLKFRGEADGFVGGYGEETAERRRFKAFVDAGDEGL